MTNKNTAFKQRPYQMRSIHLEATTPKLSLALSVHTTPLSLCRWLYKEMTLFE